MSMTLEIVNVLEENDWILIDGCFSWRLMRRVTIVSGNTITIVDSL